MAGYSHAIETCPYVVSHTFSAANRHKPAALRAARLRMWIGRRGCTLWHASAVQQLCNWKLLMHIACGRWPASMQLLAMAKHVRAVCSWAYCDTANTAVHVGSCRVKVQSCWSCGLTVSLHAGLIVVTYFGTHLMQKVTSHCGVQALLLSLKTLQFCRLHTMPARSHTCIPIPMPNPTKQVHQTSPQQETYRFATTQDMTR